jgi:ABC-2 type transport system ATP-binding protein
MEVDRTGRTLLEARGLSKRYGRGAWALCDVDLTLATGGVVGLVGPNGAGKSTLLKLFVGFERPTGGSVVVLGLDPWRERQAALSRISYLAQSPVFYRDLTVGDHLDFVAHYRRAAFDRELAARRLSDLNVPAGVRVDTLSGGQTAQLGLAIALGMRAELVLLDEPLASLDPLARQEFMDVLIDDLDQTGASAVLSSHIVSDIERACDRLVVLGVGHVQLVGRVDDILAGHLLRSTQPRDATAVVARLPDGRMLCRSPGASISADGASQPKLDDIVVGYLVAARELVA